MATTEQIEVQMRDDLPKLIRALAKTDGDRKVLPFANDMCQCDGEALQILGSHLLDHIDNAVDELPNLNDMLSRHGAKSFVTWAHLAANLD